MKEFSDNVGRGLAAPHTAVMVVTPALAEHMLKGNASNRKLRKVKVAQFASDMQNGRWAFNGEPIIFAKTGELNDGQHRLESLIEAGVTLPMNVVFGVDRESRFTLDQGSGRSTGDHVGVMGVTNPNEVSKVARLLIAYARNDGKHLYRQHRISGTEVIDYVFAHPEIQDAVKDMVSIPRAARPTSVSNLAFWQILASQNEKHIEFLSQVAAGEGISKEDPAYQVRLRLMQSGATVYQVASEIYLRGLNAFMRGDRNFRIRTIGEFPQIKAR